MVTRTRLIVALYYIVCLLLTDILGIVRSHIFSKPTLFQKLDLFYQGT
jgi:hypothetical protein